MLAAADGKRYRQVMAFLSRAFAPVLVLALTSAVVAQTKAPQPKAPAPAAPAAAVPTVKVDPAPWLYKGSDLPHDPAWVFGTLPNGLRYAVRKNDVPPGQISIRVRIDAGPADILVHDLFVISYG